MRGTPIRALVLVLMLVASCAQCLARCSEVGSSVPPCHRQQQPKSPMACQVPVVMVKDAPAFEWPAAEAVGAVEAPVLWRVEGRVSGETVRPPSIPPLLSSVLRI